MDFVGLQIGSNPFKANGFVNVGDDVGDFSQTQPYFFSGKY